MSLEIVANDNTKTLNELNYSPPKEKQPDREFDQDSKIFKISSFAKFTAAER